MTRNKVTKIMDNVTSSDSRTLKGAVDIRVITHNIRYATKNPLKGEELWKFRCPRLCSELVINSIAPPSFICLQEVLHSQLLDIHAALNDSPSAAGKWEHIGVGRDDGVKAGEYSPIFYRPEIWKLKSWDTRWMSPTPEVPSKGWDAGSIRIVTIGTFIHVETKQELIILNTHLDNEGSRSRSESVKIILRIVQMLHNNKRFPAAVLLAGDFNSPPDDDAYKIMTSPDSSMEDIYLQVAKEKRSGSEMTYTSFGHVDNMPARIDFIFSRKGDNVTYRSYGVLENRFDDGVYLSDHRACVADILLQIG
ncbi:related to endonuclease/exonuclease/phosphatase family protein [Rhynchosporium graminicola]|uniref:Related to endonuclease/exonuclease/phosphatase family protein n=1 Tax=Rhynchosporium graminicola TaxID=2792576 RepID=A0A1E1LAC5_9HELO|nr:related to endonuclease/exonuclease/phosphatase family protein [Rhynchosporium commune]